MVDRILFDSVVASHFKAFQRSQTICLSSGRNDFWYSPNLPNDSIWFNLTIVTQIKWLVAIHGNPRDFSEKISGLGLQAVLPRPRPPWMEWTVVGLLSSSMATEWDDVRRVDFFLDCQILPHWKISLTFFHSYEYLCMTPKKVEYVELWPCLPNPYLV